MAKAILLPDGADRSRFDAAVPANAVVLKLLRVNAVHPKDEDETIGLNYSSPAWKHNADADILSLLYYNDEGHIQLTHRCSQRLWDRAQLRTFRLTEIGFVQALSERIHAVYPYDIAVATHIAHYARRASAAAYDIDMMEQEFTDLPVPLPAMTVYAFQLVPVFVGGAA